MKWSSPADAMPWVGLYVCVGSLVCIIAMVADVFQGFRQRKLWFPCRLFTLNAVSITLLTVTMKLPVDLSSGLFEDILTDAKFMSIDFLVIMLANFLPSLGLMDDRELPMNMVALGIFIITIFVNICIQISTMRVLGFIELCIYIFPLLLPFSVALTVPSSRRVLHHRYRELHRLASNNQEINFSCKGLTLYVKKHWVAAQTDNPQFLIASSPVSSAMGVICLYMAYNSVNFLLWLFRFTALQESKSDYKWSMNAIVILQSIGSIAGSIAPVFRCLTAISHYNLLSNKWRKKHLLNVFRVSKHWTQRLQLWKRSHVPSHIPGRHCKKIFRTIKNMIMNLCIVLQIMVVIICNALCLVPIPSLILISFGCNCGKSFLKRFKEEANNSNMEEYDGYFLHIEEEAKPSKRIFRNALHSITRLLHESGEIEPSKLMKLLEKSNGFGGVLDFDNDQFLLLHRAGIQNCWSLVVVTLTAISLALPNNIASSHVKGLLDGMREGLEFVKHIEESLDADGDLVEEIQAARWVWTDIELSCRWLRIDLQKKARTGETSVEILRRLGDEAMKLLIRCKHENLDHSIRKFIAASSMYRISRTILYRFEQENWPEDEELFELISTVIADVLCACFTNLPRVITMKCHHDVIEKREESIRTAVQLLGKSKNILKMLEARQLPNLDMESMGYIDKWHAFMRNQIIDASSSSSTSSPASSSSNESLIVTIT